ncbi:MAG: hypothetical protein RI956_405, partial [Pseudomonadota bacterium]
FSFEEQARIIAARAKCPIGDNPTSVNPNGDWVSLYTTLSAIIRERITSNNINADDLAIIKSNKLWLDVAIGGEWWNRYAQYVYSYVY